MIEEDAIEEEIEEDAIKVQEDGEENVECKEIVVHWLTWQFLFTTKFKK